MDILARSRYLIIDDSSVIQSATRALLIKLGVPNNNVISASNAQNAIGACRTHRFDILLIDHDLGSGSNGLQLLEFLQQKELIKPQTIVFIVTGNDSQDIFFGYANFEPDGYLIKPIRADDIIKRVTSALSRQQYFSTLEQAYLKNGLNAVKPLFGQAPDPSTLKDAIIYMANILIKNQHLDEAQAMLNGLLQLHDYQPAKIKLVEIHIAKQHYHDALSQIDGLIEDNPRNIKLQQLKVKICLNTSDFESANTLIEQVLTVNGSNIELTNTMVWLQLLDNNVEQATLYLKSLAQLVPHSIWDSAGKRALILWVDSLALSQKELVNWKPEAAWQRLSHSEKSNALSKPLLKLCRTLQLIQLDQQEVAKERIESISMNEFSDNDVEAFFLLALCYQTLGLQDKLEQIKRQIEIHLKADQTSLALLQRMALQQADNFALPTLTKKPLAAVS
ncbi:response regulator [Vibrio crassostreae]|uniref:response regulator n=1 Tax=Vibrio crassostreae TaxID=246167 RepID=UPI000A8E0F01|nr:response regulator [Vibrio crassostreae]TCO05454.1 response regulator receiver domain-containing protein [Vibrio crassostreae]TCT48324.1 response regulator receiver domain-containing protein [Vibrio crassostreae]TCT68514.1 response regulator receiver domain-containing protein [Vibrio crassostreae]TCT73565.1 response regulator receiver domain-containing protein [Vibrio crassostreae]TCT93388.1 response regulator receiver domain-containing protein [Vibrio crassostreae]